MLCAAFAARYQLMTETIDKSTLSVTAHQPGDRRN
jgi:hypothetical protein